ncbi:MAG: hypothetical protein ACOH2J_17305 [Allorhizobium sp.]
MNVFRLAILALGVALSLSSCNTTDVLTPQVDVGTGSVPSSSPANAANGSINGASDQMSSSQYPGAPQAQSGYSPPPQNTLEAQAQALGTGNQGSGRLQPPSQTLVAPQGQAQTQAPSPTQVATVPPAGGGNAIRFLPIIGAPIQAVTPLSRQLGQEARARGLTIKGANDPASGHILKGYFSAFGDSGTVTVVYVWDVLDASGGRLHRIQGQEAVRSSAGDPWTAVPASVMQQIATKTIAEYLAWQQGQRG